MTAAEHLARAEKLLAMARTGEANWSDSAGLEAVLEAQGHALVALAIELGVPHATPAGGVPASADTKTAAQQR